MKVGDWESISLLGGSQTFFGILTTIVVLCIFSDRNNFIFSLLKEVKVRIECYISSLDQKDSKNTITRSSDYKLLLYLINDIESKEKNKKLYDEGLMLLNKIMLGISTLQYEFIETQPKIQKKIHFIEESKEQFLAPLYTFFFCLTIFAFDEILRSSHVGHNNFMMSWLSVFILISYLFWLLIWGYFLKRSSINLITTSLNNKSTNLNPAKKPIIQSTLYRSGICIGSVICALIAVFFMCDFAPNVCKAILIIAIVTPTLITGGQRLKSHIKLGEYTYLFLVGHFIALIMLSILFSSLIFIAIKFMPKLNVVLTPCPDCMWIKISALLFVIINGLILPFLLPYYRYNTYSNYAKAMAKKSQEQVDTSIELLRDELSDYVSKIPNPTPSEH